MAGITFILFLCFLRNSFGYLLADALDEDIISARNYLLWPNATVPFYINPDHFDQAQSLSIMTTLSIFAFKTCIKFSPLLVPPKETTHALVFENPTGVKRCAVNIDAHPTNEPYRITAGYECLRTPYIEMLIMKALGFPFEHNRVIRDIYIDVLYENIEPVYLPLFTKDTKLPLELRRLPYDVNSVMHFGERDYSKNGHKTFTFKDPNIQQIRIGLTSTDLRKIEIVYSAECRKRDRQEKIELCKKFPNFLRHKRDIGIENYDLNQNLRVNPSITPPSATTEDVSKTLKDLGIAGAINDVVDQVYRVSSLALQNVRIKYCNDTKISLREAENAVANTTRPDILGVIGIVAEFARSMVEDSVANLTAFCETSSSVEKYQIARCGYGGDNCRPLYKSTRSPNMRFSTQHRPYIQMSTMHRGAVSKVQYASLLRGGNDTVENVSEPAVRAKREATDYGDIEDAKVIAGKEKEKLAVTGIVEEKEKNHEAQSQHFEARRYRADRNKQSKDNWDDSLLSEEIGDNRKRRRDLEEKVELKKRYEISEMRKDRFAVKKYSQSRGKGIPKKKKSLERPKSNYNHQENRNEKDKRINNQSPEEEMQKKNVKQALKRRPKSDHDNQESGDDERGREQNDYQNSNEDPSVQTLPETVSLSKLNEEFYSTRRWDNGIVRYIITDYPKYDLQDLRRRLGEVNKILKRRTCVHLEELSEEDAEQFMDYLVIDTSPDFVTGKVGGRQNFGAVELFEGGQHVQHTAMMVMSMLGFYFEISRHDRDKYIRVHTRHIRPDKLHHFEKIRSDATLPLPYDYRSATHPAWQFWRKLGKTGISTVATYKDLDPDGTIMKSLGQNSELLSKIDIIKINSVYGVECFPKK